MTDDLISLQSRWEAERETWRAFMKGCWTPTGDHAALLYIAKLARARAFLRERAKAHPEWTVTPLTSRNKGTNE